MGMSRTAGARGRKSFGTVSGLGKEIRFFS